MCIRDSGRVVEAQALQLLHHQLHQVAAVSYTHLDVYKRQAYEASTPSGSSSHGRLRTSPDALRAVHAWLTANTASAPTRKSPDTRRVHASPANTAAAPQCLRVARSQALSLIHI